MRYNDNMDNEPLFVMIAGLFSIIVAALLTLVICALLGGCSPKVVYRDVEKIEYRDRVVHDTATFEIPVEVERIVTKDTTSHLDNTYAKSDAVVSGGFLYHTLESIPQTIKVPYKVTVHDTTTIIQHEESKIEYVEKELTWWQKFRIDAFWWLVAILLASAIWIFRKQILKPVKI